MTAIINFIKTSALMNLAIFDAAICAAGFILWTFGFSPLCGENTASELDVGDLFKRAAICGGAAVVLFLFELAIRA